MTFHDHSPLIVFYYQFWRRYRLKKISYLQFIPYLLIPFARGGQAFYFFANLTFFSFSFR
ncbi:MAG TPA: hypothetical protein DCR87_05510 [Acidobacteria bacterium]|nr:hypothetical protein [Acidobacteriota bacterium]